MLDPSKLRLFIPDGLGNYKTGLFNRVGKTVGGSFKGSDNLLRISEDLIPVVGCTVELYQIIKKWRETKRPWIYWDRGYLRRTFATHLPKGHDGGFYRWECDAFQMKAIRDVPDDRWKKLNLEMPKWQPPGDHILIANTSDDYDQFHNLNRWLGSTIEAIKKVSDRRIVVRHRRQEAERPLQADLDGAHICVTHGSIAAIEALMLGYPVCVDSSSAASLVGITDIARIENPVRPDLALWLYSLAYSQFHESELRDGTAWKLIA